VISVRRAKPVELHGTETQISQAVRNALELHTTMKKLRDSKIQAAGRRCWNAGEAMTGGALAHRRSKGDDAEEAARIPSKA
jgi:hypothetical protein